MPASKWYAIGLLLSSALVSAVPVNGTALSKKLGVTVPLVRRGLVKRDLKDGGVVGGAIGLGDYYDQSYSVVVTVGNSTVTLDLDTAWGDLTVISTGCSTGFQCAPQNQPLYNASVSFEPLGTPIKNYSIAQDTEGNVIGADVRGGRDAVTLAALTLANQSLLVVDNFTTTRGLGPFGGNAGRRGLGFPYSLLRNLATDVALNATNTPPNTDWIGQLSNYGGFLHRLVSTGSIERPLFVITLQRDTIDVSGTGQLTIGQLPEGIDESTVTWVPVRLIKPDDGGIEPPSFAPNEVYARGWEIELDAVFFDGTNITGSDTSGGSSHSNSTLTAAIDLHYSSLDAPSSASTAIRDALGGDTSCSHPHNLTFQIGGALFPVDPRDFYSNLDGNVTQCASSVSDRAFSPLFEERSAPYGWTLGVPFLKSNAVVFYFGNLTHPSVDPPRIGLVSKVPEDAGELLGKAVEKAESASAGLPATTQAAPTDSSLIIKSAASTGSSASGPAATGASNAGASPNASFMTSVLAIVAHLLSQIA